MQLPRQRAAISRGVSMEAWKGAGVNPAFLGGWIKRAACKACKFACNRLPVGQGLCKAACNRTVC